MSELQKENSLLKRRLKRVENELKRERDKMRDTKLLADSFERYFVGVVECDNHIVVSPYSAINAIRILKGKLWS